MPHVAVVLGSESDRKIVDESGMLDMLSGMGLHWELSIISAHRNPRELDEYVMESGADVYIGVGGMAAALPGALAACTSGKVPIIAVPLDRDGVDSCLHMPPGRPVNLVGVGKTGLKQAAQAVGQMLAMTAPEHEGAFMVYMDTKINTKEAQLVVAEYPVEGSE